MIKKIFFLNFILFSINAFSDTKFDVKANFAITTARSYINSNSKIELNLKISNTSTNDIIVDPAGYFVLSPTTDPSEILFASKYGNTAVIDISNISSYGNNAASMTSGQAIGYILNFNDIFGTSSYQADHKVPAGKTLNLRVILSSTQLGPYISQSIIKANNMIFHVTCSGDVCPGENNLYSKILFSGEVALINIAISESNRGYGWGTQVPTQQTLIPISFTKNKM